MKRVVANAARTAQEVLRTKVINDNLNVIRSEQFFKLLLDDKALFCPIRVAVVLHQDLDGERGASGGKFGNSLFFVFKGKSLVETIPVRKRGQVAI